MRATIGRATRLVGVVALALVASGHVGSPDVFFQGKAGPYDIRVVVRPPEVVPGVARVTVRAPEGVQAVFIRPVYWRVGSRGAPSADETRLQGASRTFAGSLWLMARGAYSVDVIVEGPAGRGNVFVPVASVATGQLSMGPGLGVLLVALGVLLVAGLITIVYKSAGESLVEPGERVSAERRARARKVAALAVPIVALALLGGARWWTAVDRDYERTLYRPAPLAVTLDSGVLRIAATDTIYQPPMRPSALVPDHGKLMHLFLVRAEEADAFAHLHPQALDTSAVPPFAVRLPPLPAGRYHVYGDVVHETGFERTLVGSLELDSMARATRVAASAPPADPDDAWYVGPASRDSSTRLADGSIMTLAIEPNGLITAGREETLRVGVQDGAGRSLRLEPYLGMSAHAVVLRVDGSVYVHLHPMGTVTTAARDAFLARERGDTTASGRLVLAPDPHAAHAASADSLPGTTEFPYAFPKAGSYRLFVQVKRGGRILTGAFAITVAESANGAR